jgi:hypothetical protein
MIRDAPRLHELFDLLPTFDQCRNKLRQDTLLYFRCWKLWVDLFASLRNPIQSPVRNVKPKQTHLVILFLLPPLNGSKIDIILLNNARIKGVEIHNQHITIPQPSLRIEHQTTFILVPLRLGCFGSRFRDIFLCVRIVFEVLCLRRDLFAVRFVGADVFTFVEGVEENVFITLGTTSVQGFVPGRL